MLASELGCKALDLVHVIDPSMPGALELVLKGTYGSEEIFTKEQAERALQNIASRLISDHQVASHCHVELGRPSTKIDEKAEELSAELIIVGAHGCGALQALFIGNTAYKLLHIGRRPILIVKNPPEHVYRHVLVPIDFSENSKQAAKVALAIAPSAEVTLLHAFGVPQEGLMQYASVSTDFIQTYRVGAKRIAAEQMEHFAATLDAGDRAILHRHIFGYPPMAIQEFIEKTKPDLVVMGKHGQNRVEDFLLGSVTRSTLDYSDCDMLVTLPD